MHKLIKKIDQQSTLFFLLVEKPFLLLESGVI